MESEYVYDSKYTNNKVRPDGYLVEVFMARKYSKKGKVLPPKFWNSPVYKSEFFANLAIVRGIFKTYSERGITTRTIVAALTRKEAENISWLKDERIDALIEREIEREEISSKAESFDTSDCSMYQPLPSHLGKKKSTLAKLRELE